MLLMARVSGDPAEAVYYYEQALVVDPYPCGPYRAGRLSYLARAAPACADLQRLPHQWLGQRSLNSHLQRLLRPRKAR